MENKATTLPKLSVEDIVKLQEEDTVVGIVKKWVQSGQSVSVSTRRKESIEVNLLYRQWSRLFINPSSPKIDFYVDLLICATSWASNHKFMLLSKIFQENYYL